MNRRHSRQTADRIPHAELMKYRGQWIAVGPDGRRVVAGHADLEQLDSLVIAAGEDPETVAVDARRQRRRVSRRGGTRLMLEFAYQDEPLGGPPPPSLAPSAAVRWRH